MTNKPSPLRDYQEETNAEFVENVRQGKKKGVIVMPTGSGKTRCGTDLAYRAIQKGKRVLWVAHRDELIDQAATRAGKDGIPEVGIIAASFANPSPTAPMQVASVGTLLARKNFPPADLILLDECFPAGTLVDGVPIEQIREGDYVRCWDHKRGQVTSRPVVRLFRKKSPTLTRVYYTRPNTRDECDRWGVNFLECTANHPIFSFREGVDKTDFGCPGTYRPAESLKEGDRIFILNRRGGSDRGYNDSLEWCAVSSTHTQPTEWDPVSVFNIEVEEHHNYFANGILVHNCHHYSAEHWSTVIKHYEGRTIAGLTATPAKKSGAPLGDFFEFLVHGPQPADLIAAGHLVPCEVVAPPKPMKGGIAWDPFDAWKRFSGGRRTMAFYATVEEAKQRRDQFVAAGIPAATISQATPPDVRRAILKDLSDGRIKVVTNVFVLTEGTDVPPVEVCMIARTCGSASMVIQCVGRAMRPSPETGKKKALWIDLAGCVHKFGTMDCERIYSLHGDEGLTTAKQSLDNLKCKKCGMIMPKDENGACVGCGYTAPPKEDDGGGPKIKNVDISFFRQMQANPGLIEAYARLVVSGRQKGYKDALAAKRFFEMYEQWPEADWLPWLDARIFPLFQTDRALPSNFTRVLMSAISEIAA